MGASRWKGKPAPDQPIDSSASAADPASGLALAGANRRVAWPVSELLTEAAIVVIAFTLMAVRARRLGSTILRLEVLKDLNFALAAFYNFILSALLFTTIVFLPAIAEGPLGYGATMAGLTIVPRGALMIVAMLLVGQMIGTGNYRILLATGWLLVAAGMVLLSVIPRVDGAIWIIAGSTLQAIGGGMLFTPLITLGLSTLAPELRTDATGLYSLLRQVGSASGLALMTGLLQVRIQAHLPVLPAGTAGSRAAAASDRHATLRAYAECFRVMVLAAVAVMPGVVLFRRPSRAAMEPAARQPIAVVAGRLRAEKATALILWVSLRPVLSPTMAAHAAQGDPDRCRGRARVGRSP
jgi:DHA2 family multidrug resistance protein